MNTCSIKCSGARSGQFKSGDLKIASVGDEKILLVAVNYSK